MESILFFIKRKKLLKDGTAPVYVRITVKKLSTEIATKKSILPSSWVAIKGRAKGNNLKNKQLNSFLDQLEYDLHDISIALQKEGKEVSSKEIFRRYKGDDESNISIVELYEEHNKQIESLVGISTAHATYLRHETSLKLFKEFLQSEYKRMDISVRAVNITMLEKYKYYLQTTRHNNNNTTVKYLRNIGKILNTAINRGIISSSPLLSLELKIDEVEKEYLTKDELENLIKKHFEINRLEQVKDVFLFCCMTGLAYVDVAHLTCTDLVANNGELWIKKARSKTNNMCYIPILKPALSILEKYRYQEKTVGQKLLPVLSNQKMNAYLKEIADICGIRKRLSTHCARHTFATTVTLANNVSIENVSKMLGHKNIKMTQHYAKILDTTIAKDMLKVDTALKELQL